MNKSTKIALGVTLLATAAALYIRWRNRQDDTDAPSLLDTLTNQNIYHMDCDFSNIDILPLGYRSNNPVNIRYVDNNHDGKEDNGWRGLTGKVTTINGDYCTFRDILYGYRAALVLLRGRGYIGKGLNTIRKIITKFAPKDDHNDPAGYMQRVCKTTGIDPDEVISKNDRDKLTRIVYAMSIVENGTKDKAGNSLEATYGLPSMEIINKAWEIM